jgi:hypothetical protein
MTFLAMIGVAVNCAINSEAGADHFESNPHDPLGLRVEPLSVKVWSDGHFTLPVSGGSATGLSSHRRLSGRYR